VWLFETLTISPGSVGTYLSGVVDDDYITNFTVSARQSPIGNGLGVLANLECNFVDKLVAPNEYFGYHSTAYGATTKSRYSIRSSVSSLSQPIALLAPGRPHNILGSFTPDALDCICIPLPFIAVLHHTVPHLA